MIFLVAQLWSGHQEYKNLIMFSINCLAAIVIGLQAHATYVPLLLVFIALQGFCSGMAHTGKKYVLNVII